MVNPTRCVITKTRSIGQQKHVPSFFCCCSRHSHPQFPCWQYCVICLWPKLQQIQESLWSYYDPLHLQLRLHPTVLGSLKESAIYCFISYDVIRYDFLSESPSKGYVENTRFEILKSTTTFKIIFIQISFQLCQSKILFLLEVTCRLFGFIFDHSPKYEQNSYWMDGKSPY